MWWSNQIMSISTNDSLAYLKYKLRCLINKHTSFVSSLTAADEDLGAISPKNQFNWNGCKFCLKRQHVKKHLCWIWLVLQVMCMYL